MAKLSDLHNAIVKGNLELAVSTTQEALQENIDPQTLISDYLIKGMEEIGTQFEAGKAYVPNLLMSARAMKGALELLLSLIHISEPTRQAEISYAVFCLKKKKNTKTKKE